MTLAERDESDGLRATASATGAARAERPVRTRDKQLTVVAPKVNLRQRVQAIWRYRELLAGMTRKELRVMYKDSVLGFLWSLVNPLTTMLVYFVVFQIILKNGIPRFAIYLMSGLLVWNFFSTAVSAACGSVVANSSIIKKVSFPREIPALASVGSQIVQQLGFQSIVMAVFLVVFRRGPAMEYLPLLIPALIALLLLAAAFGVIFAAVNVRMRDMQYLLSVALQIWVWACPIMYQYHLVQQKVLDHPAIKPIFVLWRLNPILPIVLTFQRTLYSVTSPLGTGGARIHILPDHAGPLWYLWQLGAVIAFAVALLVVAFKLFDRLEGNFAEEL